MSAEAAARRALAESVRAACLEAAARAYEEGGMSGLCAEGRFDLALDAIRALDVEDLLAADRDRDQSSSPPSHSP